MYVVWLHREDAKSERRRRLVPKIRARKLSLKFVIRSRQGPNPGRTYYVSDHRGTVWQTLSALMIVDYHVRIQLLEQYFV